MVAEKTNHNKLNGTVKPKVKTVSHVNATAKNATWKLA